MKLKNYYDGIEIHRKNKIIYVRFVRPHRVLSSSRGPCGGMQDGLEYLYNHQCCEPSGHEFTLYDTAAHRPHQYQGIICGFHNLPAEGCADLSTAANMNNAAVVHERYEDVEVVAVVTGGVRTNAAKAGDPGVYHLTYDENFTSSCPSKETHGTINIILCLSLELSPGAMVQGVITATEAKSSVLQEYGIPSRYSDGYATGTGTDQIGIASMFGEKKILDAGKHSKTGELIGVAVRGALKETLKRQNGLSPEGQCSVFKQVERLGIKQEEMRANIAARLDADTAGLYKRNFESVDRDPHTVAAVSALIAVRDKCAAGILPPSVFPETAFPYLVQVALSVSGDPERRAFFEERCSEFEVVLENEKVLDAVCRAVALGFYCKWESI